MKKTLIALLALAGVASAAIVTTPTTLEDPKDYSYVVYEGTNLNLSSATTVEGSSMISNIESSDFSSSVGYFISDTKSDANDPHNCSPGFGKVVLTLNLTNLTGTGNIFSVITAGGAVDNNYRGWGVILKADGALTFARVKGDTTIHDQATSLGTLEAGTTYTITIVSNGTKDSNGIVGRGTGNFDISVFDGTTANTYSVTGFGLNGQYLDKFVIGQASGVNGTLSVTAMVPEPATATLSLLALAGLCARRRRA